MKVDQLRKLLEASCLLMSVSERSEGDRELRQFLTFLPASDSSTVAALVKRVQANWARLEPPREYPISLRQQLEKLSNLVMLAGATKAAADINSLLTLFQGAPSTQVQGFVEKLCQSRDLIARQPSPRRNSGTPREDKLVASYVERLQSSVFSPQAFADLLSELESNTIPEAKVKKIAKALSGKSGTKRTSAIQEIIRYQNKKALSKSDDLALEATGV